MWLVQGRSYWLRVIVLAQSIVLIQGTVLAQLQKKIKKSHRPSKTWARSIWKILASHIKRIYKWPQYGMLLVEGHRTGSGFARFLFFIFSSLFFWGAESVTAFGAVTNIERVTWKWKSLFLRSPQEFENLSRNFLGSQYNDRFQEDIGPKNIY